MYQHNDQGDTLMKRTTHRLALTAALAASVISLTGCNATEDSLKQNTRASFLLDGTQDVSAPDAVWLQSGDGDLPLGIYGPGTPYLPPSDLESETADAGRYVSVTVDASGLISRIDSVYHP